MSTALPILSFLLLVLTAISFPSPSYSQNTTAVYDVFGTKVTFYAKYYLETSINRSSTVLGITVANATCPVIIVADTEYSVPVQLNSVPYVGNVVTLGQVLNIQLVNNPCDTVTARWGTASNIARIPGSAVIGGLDYNVFQIAKFQEEEINLYKLRYCPYNPLCNCTCVDVGYKVNGNVISVVLGANETTVLPISFRPVGPLLISQVV